MAMVDEAEGAEYAAALEEFIGRWSLREDSVNLLVALEPEQQARVLEEFSPRDTNRDVNGIFLKFAGGIANNAPRGGKGKGGKGAERAILPMGTPETDQFSLQWSLGEEAQEVLLSLEPEMQAKVMQDFSPRDTSRDANVIFIKFAQSMSKGKGKGKGKDFGKGKDYGKGKDFGMKGKGKGDAYYPSYGPEPTPLRAQAFLVPQSSKGKGKTAQAPSVYDIAPTEDPQEFANMWKLDEQSTEIFFAMDPAQMAKVMQEFKPRDTSRDVNRIFFKFASGIAENRDRGGPVAALKAYIAKWNLNEDAQNIFFNLRPESQIRVMAEFNPRDTSRDVSNIFMKFSQGIDMGLNRGKGGFPGGGKGFGGKGFGRPEPY